MKNIKSSAAIGIGSTTAKWRGNGCTTTRFRRKCSSNRGSGPERRNPWPNGTRLVSIFDLLLPTSSFILSSMHLTLGELHEILGGTLRFGAMPPCDGDAALVGASRRIAARLRRRKCFGGWSVRDSMGPILRKRHLSAERRASSCPAAASSRGPAAGRWKSTIRYQALRQLAAWNRRQFAAPLVAVTGSVGKTTTRQMIDAVLGSRLAGAQQSQELQQSFRRAPELVATGALASIRRRRIGCDRSRRDSAVGSTRRTANRRHHSDRRSTFGRLRQP